MRILEPGAGLMCLSDARDNGEACKAQSMEKEYAPDGTELGVLQNNPLAKLGEVEHLLINEERCATKTADIV